MDNTSAEHRMILVHQRYDPISHVYIYNTLQTNAILCSLFYSSIEFLYPHLYTQISLNIFFPSLSRFWYQFSIHNAVIKSTQYFRLPSRPKRASP